MVRKKKKISISKFLGVNEKADFARMLSGEARMMKNYRVTGDYSIKKRGGFGYMPSLYHTGANGAPPSAILAAASSAST